MFQQLFEASCLLYLSWETFALVYPCLRYVGGHHYKKKQNTYEDKMYYIVVWKKFTG